MTLRENYRAIMVPAEVAVPFFLVRKNMSPRKLTLSKFFSLLSYFSRNNSGFGQRPIFEITFFGLHYIWAEITFDSFNIKLIPLALTGPLVVFI